MLEAFSASLAAINTYPAGSVSRMNMLIPASIIEPRRFCRLISTAWSGVIARITSVQLTSAGER